MVYIDLGALWVLIIMSTSLVMTMALSHRKTHYLAVIGWLTLGVLSYLVSFATFPLFFVASLAFLTLILWNFKKGFWNFLTTMFFHLSFSFILSLHRYLDIDEGRLLVYSWQSFEWLPFFPLLALIFSKHLIQLNKQWDTYPYIVPMVCSWNQEEFNLWGFVDTGNRVKIGGLPVVFISAIKEFPLPKNRQNQFHTFAGTLQNCQTFRGKVQVVPNPPKEVIFALTPQRKDFYGCDCLISPLILKEVGL